ncbi:phosphate ABC transporter substrate-binding protein PstS [Polaromonas sp. JS666]|uniref:phosphate ABC transporter substrate-binding protein PstS n=1 Tax=Polaromonas sp. (strain JS666 / ATCC BAA-500) TaxID=296591 RepID=UPI0000464484|nr:phosphate ABC transporter substrate-binding protein PstS [Polaromonas sp. JS666]ABE46058.1 phosphate ABC transporter substrate-binding protein, PhoT family [Polaromonas sp. JS666]
MKKNLFAIFTAFTAVLFFAQAGAASAETISGAGSSAAAPIYQAWARAYQKSTGAALAYEPVGSSAGLKKIRAHETGFGASDVAPTEAELAASGLLVFPVAITGISPVVNLPKVGDGQLRLTGEVLARIFLGEITQWNAAEIVQLNPGLKLPDLPVKVVVRGDGSGTTYNFADYLAKLSPTWKAKYGVKTSVDWPATFVAVKGSDAVVKNVRETVGTIGYVDHGYVRDHKLTTVQLKNLDGEFVSPSIVAFRAALSSSEWASTGSFTSTLTNKAGKATWPITMGTFALVPKVADQPAQTLPALRFFVWAFLNGDALVQENNFVRLPDRVQATAFKAITSVKDKAGNAIAMGLMTSSGSAR